MSNNGNYQNAYKKASVSTLDQNKLIIMLYDGAIKNASFAVEHMKSGEIEKVHNCLIKAKNIVTYSYFGIVGGFVQHPLSGELALTGTS